MKLSLSHCLIALLAVGGCQKSKQKSRLVSDGIVGGFAIVDEIHVLSQDLDTDGMTVVVRGWLVDADEVDGFWLYNAAWDLFAPETKQGIPRILLRFENPPSDYWIGQYANISGIIVTEPSSDGTRTVILDKAAVVSQRVEGGEVIPFRQKRAHVETPNGR